MNIKTEEKNKITIIKIDSESIDITNSSLLRNSINDIIETNPNVALDFEKIQFIDSSGCGAVIWCMKTAQESGGRLCLYGIQKQVKLIFELVKLDKIIDIFNSSDDAQRSFA